MKKKKVKERNLPAYMMAVHCKPGHHGDKRKRASKEACRKFDRRNYYGTKFE